MTLADAGARPVVLQRGDLRFTAYAAGSGPLVLCVHGFPDNARTFRRQFAPLVAAGYRVVAATIRGYEPGSQPRDGDYRIESLAGDIVAWIDGLGEERAHLVGHDWGAVMAYVACARAPQRFRSLTALGIPPPGPIYPHRHPQAASAAAEVLVHDVLPASDAGRACNPPVGLGPAATPVEGLVARAGTA
jgi:pimeloyl-ACP methyl ester carboxylesterase